jgi:acetyl esterase/lipase
VLAAAVGVLVAGTLATRARADVTCSPSTEPRATVLLIHGGGFLSGSAGLMMPECRAFAAIGYRAVSLDYPIANLAGARAYVFAAARRYRSHGRTYAVGSSAGGTLAALLALEGRVDGAVAAGPLVDLLREPSPRSILTRRFCRTLRRVARAYMRKQLSPVYATPHGMSPLVLVQDPHDPVVDFGQTAAFASRYHLTLIRSRSGHSWPVRVELRAFWMMLAERPSASPQP